MTHCDFLRIHAAICDRLYSLPFLATSPKRVEQECLRALLAAARDHYLHQEGGIYAAELYAEEVAA